MKKPNILITNDDGIFSSGIFALWEVVNPISNVSVIAPKNQQSAMSHALTLSRPLRVERIKRVNEFYFIQVVKGAANKAPTLNSGKEKSTVDG